MKVGEKKGGNTHTEAIGSLRLPVQRNGALGSNADPAFLLYFSGRRQSGKEVLACDPGTAGSVALRGDRGHVGKEVTKPIRQR